MPLPTLKQTGSLVPRMKENEKKLKNKVAVDYILEWLDDRIPKEYNKEQKIKINSVSDKIIVLKSKTGSGKSTTLPSEIYLKFNKRVNKTIAITEPKVVTAIEITKDIDTIKEYKKDEYNKIEINRNLGYQTGPFTEKPIERGIIFMSIGVLAQILIHQDSEDIIKKYSFIIIDEVHERSIELDLVLFNLKKLIKENLKNNPPFVILMSATMDESIFLKYFETKTIFEVEGNSYEIITNYSSYDIDNYNVYAANLIKEIHISNKNDFLINDEINYNSNGDIIVFMSTQSLIKNLNKILEKINNELKYKLVIITLTSYDVNNITQSYKNLFLELDKIPEKPVRRVILATNVVETGITINTLKYCIDSGYNFSTIYNPLLNFYIGLNGPITKNMVMQRKGRVGRKNKGYFYPLYTEETFNNLQENTYPNIFTEDFTLHLLNIIIKEENKFDIFKINLLNRPQIDTIKNSLNKLFVLGFIDKNKNPTKLGIIANKFRKIKLEDIKVILSGFYYDINISDLITLGCYQSLGNKSLTLKGFKDYPFSLIDKDNKIHKKLKLLISCEFLNFIIFFNNFISLILHKKYSVSKIKKLCEENYINFEGLINLQLMRDEIINNLVFNIGLNPFKNKEKNLIDIIEMKNDNLDEAAFDYIKKFKSCLYEGYKLNIATLRNENYYTSQGQIKLNTYYINLFKMLNENNFEKPKKILYSVPFMQLNSFTNNYELTVSNGVSILSSYIETDDLFIVS